MNGSILKMKSLTNKQKYPTTVQQNKERLKTNKLFQTLLKIRRLRCIMSQIKKKIMFMLRIIIMSLEIKGDK